MSQTLYPLKHVMFMKLNFIEISLLLGVYRSRTAIGQENSQALCGMNWKHGEPLKEQAAL